MLKRIELNNFKQHEHLVIDFIPGANLITGPNYVGKSTILYAILYALGGSTYVPGTVQNRDSTGGLRVILDFEARGKQYRIDRKKASAELFEDEISIATGMANVTTRVEELLGMSIRRFRQLKFARQKLAHELLKTGAAELHLILEELTGLDQINKALAGLKEILTSVSGGLDARPAVDEGPLQTALDEADATLDDLIRRVQEAQAEVCRLEEQHSEASIELKSAKELADRHETLSSRRHNLLGKLEEMAYQIRKLDKAPEISLETLTSRAASMQEELKRAEKAYAEAEKVEITRIRLTVREQSSEERLKTAQEELGAAQAALAALPDPGDTDALSAALTKANEALRLVSEQAKVFSNQLDNACCPACNRPFENVDVEAAQRGVDELLPKADALRKEVKRLENVLGQAAEAGRALKAATKAVEGAKTRLAALEAQHVADAAELASLPPETDTEAMREGLDAFKQALREVERQIKAEKSRQQALQEAQDAANEVEAELAACQVPDFDPAAYTALRTRVAGLAADLGTARVTLATETGLQGQVKERLTAATSALLAAQESNLLRRALQARHDNAKALQKYLRDNRDRYSREVWDMFLSSASQFVSACTEGRIEAIRRSDDGAFLFVENGADVALADASGAQEAILGLSVQMALAESTGCPLDTLLIDEATADMDPEHSMAVTALLSSKGRQIIAVTHREMDASMGATTIRLERPA